MLVRKEKRNTPEDNSKQESESRDQIAHSRSKSGRTVIYPSEYKVLHPCNPAKKPKTKPHKFPQLRPKTQYFLFNELKLLRWGFTLPNEAEEEEFAEERESQRRPLCSAIKLKQINQWDLVLMICF